MVLSVSVCCSFLFFVPLPGSARQVGGRLHGRLHSCLRSPLSAEPVQDPREYFRACPPLSPTLFRGARLGRILITPAAIQSNRQQTPPKPRQRRVHQLVFFLCSGAGGAAAKAAPFTADCAFGCARLVCSRLCNQLAATAPLSCKPPSLSNRSVFICPSTNLSTGAPQGQRLVAQ